MTLGEYLRESRLKHYLTLVEVARHVGVSQPTVTYWEQNRHIPDPERIMKLHQILKLNGTILVDLYVGRYKFELIKRIKEAK